MPKIRINKSQSADSRTADHPVSKEELREATESHIKDVRKGMLFLARELVDRSKSHDWTKLDYLDEFYDQYFKSRKSGDWGSGWYENIHMRKERHHLDDNPPEDVDLLDVLEKIVDGVMAGLARSGEYRHEDLPEGLLERAYDNTAKKLQAIVEVADEDPENL